VERIAEEIGEPLNIKHLIYSDLKAQSFAKLLGKETGTAKHVAGKAGINVDWDYVHAVVKDPPSQPEDFDEINGIARISLSLKGYSWHSSALSMIRRIFLVSWHISNFLRTSSLIVSNLDPPSSQ
jgi:hypothetical protein